MSRPFTRRQALENAAFLGALRESGNVREAARICGVHRSTYMKRRARDAAFAVEWDAALTIADARLDDTDLDRRRDTDAPRIIRTASGRFQLRRIPPGRLTRPVEQAFLFALSATANVRLSAAAAGFSHSAFYARAQASPAFAREMRLALQTGYERLEYALLASMEPDANIDDSWRHNAPPPIPPMTVDQALRLLYLHDKVVHGHAEPPHFKRRRGESDDARAFRLAAMYEAKRQREREDFLIAEAARRDRDERSLHEPPPPSLPALDQVTWRRARR